jgi:hypothetical protein
MTPLVLWGILVLIGMVLGGISGNLDKKKQDDKAANFGILAFACIVHGGIGCAIWGCVRNHQSNEAAEKLEADTLVEKYENIAEQFGVCKIVSIFATRNFGKRAPIIRKAIVEKNSKRQEVILGDNLLLVGDDCILSVHRNDIPDRVFLTAQQAKAERDYTSE